jgi:hypothetical protein
MNRIIAAFIIALLIVTFACDSKKSSKLDMENYFAWCIVPFDSEKRTPEQRIEMLKELGFTSYAYDWRVEHLPEMVKEFTLAKENGIEVNAVWLWIDKNDEVGKLSESNQKVLEAVKEAGLQTQIWMSYPENYFEGMSDDESLSSAVEMISYLSDLATEMDCKIGMYNHGGWFGHPDNLVKIAKAIPEKEVGVIFNFHHAHHLLDDFPALVKNMLPHLLAVNLNGMNPDGPKILRIGQGSEEAKMIQVLKDSGYNGLWGILGHIMDADVKLVLEGNLEGLKSILE